MKWFLFSLMIFSTTDRIESLFKRASKWRVGSAISEVEAARDTLKNMGDSAVLMVLKKHIKTESLLELRALKAIMKEKHPVYMDSLRAYILSRNDTVKIAAIYLAGELKDTQSIPNLIKSLKDTSLRVKLNALMAMGKMGDTSCGKYICQSLKSKNQREVVTALSAITTMGYKSCISSVYKKMHEKDANSFVKYVALFAISSMKDTAFVLLKDKLTQKIDFYDLSAFYETIRRMRKLSLQDTLVARKIFKSAFKNTDAATRIIAVRGLCQLSGEDVLKNFLFDETDRSVRFEIKRCFER